MPLLSLSLLFIANSNPLRSSPFDPYGGDPGIAPWQLLIDEVNARGGLTFWNYPETHSGIREMGPIKVHTAPYPQVLEESNGYTGFAALYGDTSTITEPGELWDRVLMDYCKGYRTHPAWGIATADYHKEGEAGEKLGNFQTGFFVEKLTRKEILEALKTGRVYAYRGHYPRYARLEEFSVSSADGDSRAISGGQVVLKGNPVVRFRIAADQETQEQVVVRLIRAGCRGQSVRRDTPPGDHLRGRILQARARRFSTGSTCRTTGFSCPTPFSSTTGWTWKKPWPRGAEHPGERTGNSDDRLYPPAAVSAVAGLL